MTVRLTIAAVALLFSSSPTLAQSGTGSLVVTVSGIRSAEGDIRCGLYASADGFPMRPETAVHDEQPARAGSVTCRFDNLSPGRYAVSVSHDLNGNDKTDTNFLGIPREDWGVSNNVRPSMRAPRFAEAAFIVAPGAPTRVTVEIGR